MSLGWCRRQGGSSRSTHCTDACLSPNPGPAAAALRVARVPAAGGSRVCAAARPSPCHRGAAATAAHGDRRRRHPAPFPARQRGGPRLQPGSRLGAPAAAGCSERRRGSRRSGCSSSGRCRWRSRCRAAARDGAAAFGARQRATGGAQPRGAAGARAIRCQGQHH